MNFRDAHARWLQIEVEREPLYSLVHHNLELAESLGPLPETTTNVIALIRRTISVQYEMIRVAKAIVASPPATKFSPATVDGAAQLRRQRLALGNDCLSAARRLSEQPYDLASKLVEHAAYSAFGLMGSEADADLRHRVSEADKRIANMC